MSSRQVSRARSISVSSTTPPITVPQYSNQRTYRWMNEGTPVTGTARSKTISLIASSDRLRPCRSRVLASPATAASYRIEPPAWRISDIWNHVCHRYRWPNVDKSKFIVSCLTTRTCRGLGMISRSRSHTTSASSSLPTAEAQSAQLMQMHDFMLKGWRHTRRMFRRQTFHRSSRRCQREGVADPAGCPLRAMRRQSPARL